MHCRILSGCGRIALYFDRHPKERRWIPRKEKSKRNPRKVNQYEAMWGRETILDERNTGPMPVSSRAHPSALYVNSIGSTEIIPFNLPDTRGERLIRIGFGGQWNLTSSISADVPGEHTLKVTRAVDLKLIPHVSTRASPEYDVRLPPIDAQKFTNELGLWFETEWGNERNLIVKAVKKDSFAFRETDVHVGDELLFIDRIPVSRMTFSEAMAKIRNRLTEVAEKAPKAKPRSTLRRSSLRLVGAAVGLGRSQPSTSTDFEPLVLNFRTVEGKPLCRSCLSCTHNLTCSNNSSNRRTPQACQAESC
jgi:hypothetical protein